MINNTNQVIKHIFYLWDEDMLFYCLFNGHCLYRELRSTSYPLSSRHALANLAQLAVLNAIFASLAFVKYRGAQITLGLGDRQCSLAIEYAKG